MENSTDMVQQSSGSSTWKLSIHFNVLHDSLAHLIYGIITVPHPVHLAPWTYRHEQLTGIVSGVMLSPKQFITFCLPEMPILPITESTILETSMGSRSSTWEESKAFPTSLFYKCVHGCHSWPAHCIPHSPPSYTQQMTFMPSFCNANSLRKHSSTNMMTGILLEWHHTNECHGSAQSCPLQHQIKKFKLPCAGLQESHSTCSQDEHTNIISANSLC
jgi:hypothetical protein